MQLNPPRHTVETSEKGRARRLQRRVSARTATRPPVARNRTSSAFPSSAGLSATCSQRNLDRGHPTAFEKSPGITVGVLDAVGRQSVSYHLRGYACS
jgi:hypothetical protein